MLHKKKSAAKCDARQRVNEAGPTSGKVTPMETRVKFYDKNHGTNHWDFIRLFLFKGTDGRELFNFKAFRDHVHADDKSTAEGKAHADFLWFVAGGEDVPLNEYGEWHHLWPLCVFGSVEDDRNYRRVRPLIHIKVHAVLIFFFPWIYGFHLSLDILISTNKKEDGKKPGKVSKEVLDAALAEMGLAQVAADARIARAEFARENSMGNQNGKKPPSDDPSINKRRTAKIRSNQRRAKNEERALKGLPPLTPLKTGIVPTLTGDPKRDKYRADKRKSNKRRAQNKVRAQEGRSPLKRLNTGPVPTLSGDAKKDKTREQNRLSRQRSKLNAQRRKENKPLLEGKYTKEEIEAFDPPLQHY